MAGTLILLSGGLNSTVALYEAFEDENLSRPYHAITFNYGQDSDELTAAQNIFKKAIAKFIPSPVSITSCEDLPNHETYCIFHFKVENKTVTYENAFYLKLLQFLAAAAIYALNNDLSDIVIGISTNKTERTEPEFERDFIDNVSTAIADAASLSGLYHKRPLLHTPLIGVSKEKIFEKAYDLGILELVLNETYTCHAPILNPEYPDKIHEWGKGCGTCNDCSKRKKGWAKFQRNLQRQKDKKEKESVDKVTIGNITYMGVGNPARWVILDRDNDSKSSIVKTHGKERLFISPTEAWDWIKTQHDTEKFYTVTGQDAARHVMREQGGS